MIRIVTIAREFGSGGGAIARHVAKALGWELIDKRIIETIAEEMHASREAVESVDERGSTIGERISEAWRLGASESYASVLTAPVLNARSVHEFSKDLIRKAAKRGQCVIVGRGAQCILGERPDALHVFVYAPIAYRLSRVRGKYDDDRLARQVLGEIDASRSAYLREFFEAKWKDPLLYDVCINGKMGVQRATEAILSAVRACP